MIDLLTGLGRVRGRLLAGVDRRWILVLVGGVVVIALCTAGLVVAMQRTLSAGRAQFLREQNVLAQQLADRVSAQLQRARVAVNTLDLRDLPAEREAATRWLQTQLRAYQLPEWIALRVESERSELIAGEHEHVASALEAQAMATVLFAVVVALAAGLVLWQRRRAWHAERKALAEKLAMEETAARADRISALGLLTSSVAHEINNPLTYVLSNLDFAAEQLADPHAGAGSHREIVDALTSRLARCKRRALPAPLFRAAHVPGTSGALGSLLLRSAAAAASARSSSALQ